MDKDTRIFTGRNIIACGVGWMAFDVINLAITGTVSSGKLIVGLVILVAGLFMTSK